jgi:N-acetylneuraminic acid mutarotase
MRRVVIASCLLILVSVATVVSVRISTTEAGTSGVWSAAANLITGREEHTATLLQNSTVLVAGGTDGRGDALASAELYNPKTNRWMSAGTMATTRLDHTATLLPNGKVLVVGGLDTSFPSNSLASAELYDPKTRAWSSAASMAIGRARHTATLLPDGRVLVVGGLSVTLRDGGLFPNQPVGAEIYDPAIDRWSRTGPMSSDRLDHTATLLHDGRVLIAGGLDSNNASRSDAEIYDPKQNLWVAVASMTTGRELQTATLLANGDVLLVGGQAPETDPSYPYGVIPTATSDVYAPGVDRWSPVASMSAPRIEHTSTLLRNGTVLVVGNAVPGTSRAEVYDPTRNRWSSISEPMHRYHHTATQLPDGRVLVVGGYGIESLASVLLYDPSATAQARRAPTNPLVVIGLLLAALVILATVALSIPDVRRRLRGWRGSGRSEEWIK